MAVGGLVVVVVFLFLLDLNSQAVTLTKMKTFVTEWKKSEPITTEKLCYLHDL